MHITATTSWSPEQWTTMIVVVVGSISGAVVSVIGAMRTQAVHKQVIPPSNGATLGALVEGIGQVQHMVAGLTHPDSETPAAMTVARSIQAAAGADPTNPADAPADRRSTDPEPVP